MGQNSRIFRIVCIISILILNETCASVLLMSKDDMHLQQEQFSNIVRTVRSKVGQPNVVELWEGSVNNNNLPSDLNRIRRSATEKHVKDDTGNELRYSRSLNQPSSSDVPANDLLEPRLLNDRDQIHVVSSAIRVLSTKEDKNGEQIRQKRNELQWREPKITTKEESNGEQIREKRNEFHWRKPRTSFVTRTERMSPLAPRYQFPPERSDRYLLDNELAPGYRRTSALPQRRIIYYATLPEIVRRPLINSDWPQQQQQLQQLQQYTSSVPSRQQPVALESRPYYPVIRDNEVTRVQSSVIDVTNRDPPTSPSQTPTIISSVLAAPKYTIIDAEPPPYARPYYNNYPYNVRYPQPYYNNYNNGNNNNNYYYDDIRTPPYRIQQSFQPPYYNKPEYIPVELPAPSSTASSSSSSSQHSLTDSDLQKITTTNSTATVGDKHDKNNIDENNSSHHNSVNSRYV